MAIPPDKAIGLPSPLVIYHDGCADGIAAAWCFHRSYGDWATYHPGRYSDPPPDVAHRHVFLVDFSYKRPVVEDMLKTASTVTLIDHHKTALDDLKGLHGLAVFRTAEEHSGCVMAWKYLFGEREVPPLLRFIEDRDLWRFHFPATKAVCRGLFAYPLTLETIDRFTEPGGMLSLGQEGDILLRSDMVHLNQILDRAVRTMRIGDHDVPVANAPHWLASDLGHVLAQDAPFAGSYWDSADHRHFSLRSSRETGLDVSQVALQYGGGGHRNAAGFAVSRTHQLSQG